MTEKKETTKKAPAKKEVLKKASSGKTVRIRQVGSPIGRQGYQRQTLIGLGLNKLGRESELEDTPAVRGMINSVQHLLEIVEAA